MNLFDVEIKYDGLPGRTVRILAKLASDAENRIWESDTLIVPSSVKAKRVIHGTAKVADHARKVAGI